MSSVSTFKEKKKGTSRENVNGKSINEDDNILIYLHI